MLDSIIKDLTDKYLEIVQECETTKNKAHAIFLEGQEKAYQDVLAYLDKFKEKQ